MVYLADDVAFEAEELAENRKNGKSKKTVKSTSGEFELETPRDRAGTFEPQLVKMSVFKQMGQMFGFAKGVFCSSFSCYAACR